MAIKKVSILLVSAITAFTLSSCSASQPEALKAFPEDEIQLVRQDAEKNGVHVDDEYLLSTLQFRATCKDLNTILKAINSGEKPETQVDAFGEVIDKVKTQEGSASMSATFSTYQDELRLGQFDNLSEFHSNSCAGVE